MRYRLSFCRDVAEPMLRLQEARLRRCVCFDGIACSGDAGTVALWCCLAKLHCLVGPHSAADLGLCTLHWSPLVFLLTRLVVFVDPLLSSLSACWSSLSPPLVVLVTLAGCPCHPRWSSLSPSLVVLVTLLVVLVIWLVVLATLLAACRFWAGLLSLWVLEDHEPRGE